jgi:lipopolysaccharide export system permease protein
VLYRYVAREALLPTLIALVGLTAVVLTKELLGLSDLAINRGFSTGAVSLIAFFEALPIGAQMFPFAVLLGCLVALGRLGADREILALESVGVTAARLVWPVISFAGVMALLSLMLSLIAAPWANRSLDLAFERLSREKPWARIRAGTVSEFGEWQLEAREVSSSGTELRGVLLWTPTISQTIFARSGHVETTADGSVELTLTHGNVVLSPRGGVKQLRFDQVLTTLPETDESLERSEVDRMRGFPLSELFAIAQGLGALEDNLERSEPMRASTEIHRRLAVSAATLIFGFLATPLFLTRAQFSRSSGGILGLVCTIAYFGLAQLGQGLVQGGVTGVALGAWLPNMVLGTVAVALLLRARSERVLGHVFDRPRLGAQKKKVRTAARVSLLRRYPLPRYVGWRFLQLALLSFSVLLVAYLLIDVMDRLQWFALHHATGVEIVRFYGARVFLLASRAVPMGVLIGTALTVSLLAAEGELMGMRTCGIPAPRALLPVLLISCLIAPGYFLLNNVVVPRTNALADQLKETEIKDLFGARLEGRRKAAVWYRSGTQVLEAERFDPERGDAREITIYELGEGGDPVSRTDARYAWHIGHGVWRLADPARTEIQKDRLHKVEGPRYAQLGEVLPAEVDTMHLSVASLAREIEEVEANGYDATTFRVDFHVKLSEALSCVVLPAVVLFFAVGGPPFPGPAQTLLVSGIFGVSYILLTGVAASLGYGGALPPPVAGWAPAFLFSSLAGFFGLRLWRRL